MSLEKLNAELEAMGIEGIEDVDPCPERKRYLVALENCDYGDKDEVKALKAIKQSYVLAYHKYLHQVRPHLLYERGEDKTFWDYDEDKGIYIELSFPEVRSIVISLLIKDGMNDIAVETSVKNILNRYKAEYLHHAVDLTDFLNNDGWLHVKNGWLNLTNKELAPHTPDRLSLSTLDTVYDAGATCPLYDKFLDVDTQMHKDQVRVIDQFSGYTLTNDIEQQVCLILEGRKGSGKSMLLEVWMNILGNKAVPLQLTALQGGGERFIGQTLAYKNLCWFDEANPRTSNINEFFQNLITGEKIRIERKGVQGDDFVKNNLKIVLSLNEMPDHMPTGMDRRYRHIVFNRSFYEEGIVDPDYKKKILANEKSGILNRMLRGLDELRKMGSFTMIEGEEDRKREYTLTSDDFSSFLTDHFEPTLPSEGTIRYTYEQLRNAFVAEYPKSYNKQLSVRGFNKKLLSTRLPEFKHITTAKSGGERGYKCIKLKNGHEFPENTVDPIKTPLTIDPDNF